MDIVFASKFCPFLNRDLQLNYEQDFLDPQIYQQNFKKMYFAAILMVLSLFHIEVI